MADKTPVRVVFDADSVATGLAEFQTNETVPLANGGTGSALAIGLAGQVLRVNAARNALEFADQGDVDVIASSDSAGVQVQDDLNISGTLSVNVIDVNEISSIDSTAITIKDDLMLAGTLRAEDSSTLSIDGAVASGAITSSGVVTATGFTIGSAVINESELETIDGITAGTVAASKALVVDSNKDIGTLRNITSNGTIQFGSLSDGTITATAFVDEDDMSSNSATLIPTQQSVKAYVDTELSSFSTILNVVGDDSTDMEIALGTDRLFFQGGTNISTSTDSGAQVTISVADAPTFSGAVTAAGFTIGSAAINESELETIDSVTAGTVAASKAVVVDSNKDIGSFRNVTATGSFIIGSADMNETDLEKLDGITDGAGAANKALVLDGSADVASGLRNLTASGTVTASALDVTSISSTDSSIVTVQEGLKVEGNVIVGAIQSDDSSAVSILDNLNVEGAVQVSGASVFTGDVTTAGSFVIGSASMNETDLEKLDGITNGTVAANKAVVVDGNKDAGSFRNIIATGATTSGTFVIGSADINETDLEQIDGLTAGTVSASKAVVVDSDKDITGFRNITASGNGEIGGNLQVGGNLTVSGTTTSVNTTNLEIQDALLELNKNNSGGADVDAGIFIQRGSAGNNAVLYWNEGDDSFKAVLSNSAASATSVTDSSFAALEVGSLTVNAGVAITASSGDVTVANATSNKDLIFTVNDGGSATEVFRLDGDVSAMLIADGKELQFSDSGEKISGDGTDLTIASGAKINLTATTDIHIPNDVGIVFGGDSEKIEGDGTDLVISANNLTVDAAADIILDAGGNDFNFKAGGTEILRITNSSSDVIIRPVVDAKDIIFQQRDGTEVARVEDNGTFNVVTDKLAINGTAITSTAAELNLVDGITAGTVAASKAVIVDSNKDVDGFRNVTATGTVKTALLDVNSIFSTDSANIRINEGLDVVGGLFVSEINAIDSSAIEVNEVTNFNAKVVVKDDVEATGSFIIGSASMNETDLEKLDGITNGAGAANKALVLDGSADVASGLRNVTASGSITAGSFVIGDADINETDLEKLDGITNGTVAANKAVVVDGSKDAGTFNKITTVTLDVREIESNDSTSIVVNEGLEVLGNLQVNEIVAVDSSEVVINNLRTQVITANDSTEILINDALRVSGLITGTATSAQYADLAEKYSNDQEYPVGTVMMVGGDKETTQWTEGNVCVGVISDKPAFLMNESAEGQPHAIRGKVPVRCIGIVLKGQRIYAKGTGTAGMQGSELVGIALESNTNPEEKLIECILKI